jgi:hypothetical protein
MLRLLLRMYICNFCVKKELNGVLLWRLTQARDTVNYLYLSARGLAA